MGPQPEALVSLPPKRSRFISDGGYLQSGTYWGHGCCEVLEQAAGPGADASAGASAASPLLIQTGATSIG